MKDRVKELAEKNSKKVNAGLPPTPKLKDEPRSPNLTGTDGNVGFPRKKTGEEFIKWKKHEKSPELSAQDCKGLPSAQNNGYKKVKVY